MTAVEAYTRAIKAADTATRKRVRAEGRTRWNKGDYEYACGFFDATFTALGFDLDKPLGDQG